MQNDAGKEMKERLKEALIALCEEKDYYDITIGDICDQARVYRSTFYYHYDNKDDLLRDLEKTHNDSTHAMLGKLSSYDPDCSADELEQYRQGMTQIMRFYRKRRKLYLFLLSPSGDPYFAKVLREGIRRSIERSLREKNMYYTVNQKYTIDFFAHGYVATIYRWLKTDDKTPEEMAQFVLQKIMLFSSVGAKRT